MSTGGLDELYREVILDHYQSPRNQGRLATSDVAARGSNPLCGDEVEISLAIAHGRVVDAAFEGQGCSISQASASMMTESIKGKTVADIAALLGRLRTLMMGKDAPPTDSAELGQLAALQGVRRYPVRVKCALLPWNVLGEALALQAARYEGATNGTDDSWR